MLSSFLGVTTYSTPRRHKAHRFEWCQAALGLDLEPNSICFNDEARFCSGGHNGRRRVRRFRGVKRKVELELEKLLFTGGIMMWGAACLEVVHL
jgi:hypothetical protein